MKKAKLIIIGFMAALMNLCQAMEEEIPNNNNSKRKRNAPLTREENYPRKKPKISAEHALDKAIRQKYCGKLKELNLIDVNSNSNFIPDDYFRGMTNLKRIYIYGTGIKGSVASIWVR